MKLSFFVQFPGIVHFHDNLVNFSYLANAGKHINDK